MRWGQFNFSKGELAPELLSRVDVPTYSTALKRARNVVALKYGGVTKRPGTRLVASVYDATHQVRLIPFQFSLASSYMLEMGHGYMRIASNGGLVIETALTIHNITLGQTTVISANYHGYSVGDQVSFQGIAGCTQINGRIATVLAVPDVNSFVCDVDSRGFSAFVSDSGGIDNTAPPPPPPPPPTVPPPTVTTKPTVAGYDYSSSYDYYSRYPGR